jgi:hydrogenase-4 component E
MHSVVLTGLAHLGNSTGGTAWPEGTGGEILDILILILLASAVLIVSARTSQKAIALLAIQSTALAGIAVVVAALSGSREMYISIALTLAVKVALVPLILWQVSRRAGTRDDAAMYFGPRTATIAALGLVLLAYGLVQPQAVARTLITGSYFPTSVALILVGGLTMVVRKKALVQVIGLVVIENGIYLAAMATTNGLPPAVELGIAFDLFVTVVLLGSIAFRIGAATETLDTSTLRRLKG